MTTLTWQQLHLARAKLKASSRTSALLSGFAMIAMVELQVNNGREDSSQVPTSLLVAFTACTTLLVSVHVLALMISTCILPNVEAVAAVNGLVAVHESPHEKMRFYIEIAWQFSTVFGIFLFLIELAILCWVKFWDVRYGDSKSGQIAALVATIILIPIGIIFIGFAVHFYRTLVSHKFERHEKNLQELENMASQLSNDQHQHHHHHHQEQPFIVVRSPVLETV
ncbi:hypothetical protein RDWZM_007464 [Blomia tropicalis]|uniref:Calcium release-activated calcium channel protein 1 n=1 Tax=Blomia tropicalis TaxID=40697 RepID=A0A9Q0LZX7_BLOTA|nr:hypothetical protein RDWZM_007464 [Blomia tropicalis]